MGFGGYHPYPRRFGGGRPPLKVLHESINAGRGTALDASNPDTIAWVEGMAYARAIYFAGVMTNERLSHQWDPARMTDMLSRWEAIYGLRPAPSDDDATRRAAVRAKMERFLVASSIHARLVTRLAADLGEVFSAIEYISTANAIITVPDASYPWGSVVSGRPWSSSVAHILILLVKPAGYTEGEFYEAAGKVAPALDGIVPAWCTFDWYRAPAAGAAVTVSGGPSQAGFYLDNDHNLDNSVFDV